MALLLSSPRTMLQSRRLQIFSMVPTARKASFGLIETIAAALSLVRDADRARASLARKATRFRAALGDAGLDTAGSATQIVPLIAGDNDAALELARRLRGRGLLAQAIRWPTVPHGSARVRFSLMATHPDDALADATVAIAQEARSVGSGRS